MLFKQLYDKLKQILRFKPKVKNLRDSKYKRQKDIR